MFGSGLGSHGFTGSWGVALSVPVQGDERSSRQVLGAFSLALRRLSESWTLTRDQRRRFNSFGTRSLENPWLSLVGLCVQRERLLRETQMRFVTFIVHEHQLRLYGHVARFPDADPAHQILSAR